jgi:multiple sugar transport system substrate-binding protein
MDKYADRVERLDEFVANMENVVDFVNGSPNWQGNDTSVRSVFYPKIQLLLLGAVSPEECGRQLDADCNKSLFIGWRDSHLHE